MRTLHWWDFEFDRVRVPLLSLGDTPYFRSVAVCMSSIAASRSLICRSDIYDSVEDAKKGSNLAVCTRFLCRLPNW